MEIPTAVRAPVVAPINLATIAAGTGGFALQGQASNDRFGAAVSAAGDINGDGFADVVIGANSANDNAGKTYVVFGKSDRFGAGVDAASIAAGTGGFVILGNAGDQLGISVSSGGDFNADGYHDLIVGTNNISSFINSSYVVFGKADGFGAQVNLASIAAGTGGFALQGSWGDEFARSVSAEGDINGDGFDDVAIGAAIARYNGISYVVFGRAGGFGGR